MLVGDRPGLERGLIYTCCLNMHPIPKKTETVLKRWFCIVLKFAPCFHSGNTDRFTKSTCTIVSLTVVCYVIQLEVCGWHSTTCRTLQLYVTPDVIGQCKLWHMSRLSNQRFGEIQTPALISIFGKKCVPNGHEIRNIKRMRLFYEKSEILILQSSLVLPYNFNCHSSLSNIYLQS